MFNELLSPWFAAQVVCKRESQIACALEYKGYEVFLPMHSVRRLWSDRIKTMKVPFFEGYVFCRARDSGLGLIISTPNVVRIVSFGGSPCPITDEEIIALRRIAALDIDSQPHPYLAVGQRVEIHSGPLTGIVGILTQIRSHHRLVVSVESIMRSVSINVDHCQVRPVETGSFS